MSNKNIKIINFLRICIDMGLVVSAWLIAFYLRFFTFFPVSKGIPVFALYLKLVPFVIVIWLMVFSVSGLYKRLKSRRSPLLEGMDILQACVFSTLAFIAVTFFYHEYRYSRLTLIIFAFIHPIFLLIGRSLIRKGLRLYKKKTHPRNVLIIGSGRNFDNVRYMIKDAYFEQTEIIGCILVGSEEQKDFATTICKEHNIKIFDLPMSWEQFLIEKNCDSVVIGLPHQAHDFIENNLKEIAQQVTSIKILPDLLKFTRFGAGVDIVNKLPVLSIHESPLQGVGAILKRILDLVGASVCLVFFFPIMLIIALIIKLTSKGPVLYVQERLGVDGQKFNILKFRSMPHNIEKDSGAKWATSNDQRPTRFGKFIRKCSLDELPQFFNVLKGEMSLVGPRPERPIFVTRFRQEIPGYMLRHKVKSGITGWAQVQGWRGNTSIDKRIECDLYYIQNWSLWLDIKILFMTLLKGFVSPNAY